MTWHYYLKSYKYEVFILTDNNNLRQFMHTNRLSSWYIPSAPKLSWYLFHIDYCEAMTNAVVDALSRFSNKSQGEKKTSRD